jgi:hypothetical protein
MSFSSIGSSSLCNKMEGVVVVQATLLWIIQIINLFSVMDLFLKWGFNV